MKNRLQKSVPILTPIFGVDFGADLWSVCHRHINISYTCQRHLSESNTGEQRAATRAGSGERAYAAISD